MTRSSECLYEDIIFRTLALGILAAGLLHIVAPATAGRVLFDSSAPYQELLIVIRQAGAGLVLAGGITLISLGEAQRLARWLTGGYLLVYSLALGIPDSTLQWLPALITVVYLVALVSRPLLRTLGQSGGMQSGRIKWFNSRKGFGFIVTESGEEIFVHFKAVREGGLKSLRPGTQVQFRVRQSEKGPQADPVFIVREHDGRSNKQQGEAD